MILDWSEEPFDEDYYKDNEFVAGDAAELSKHGVHAEYLPVLQALKQEIQAYLDWAQPQLDAGVPENQLTLFSTLNLHIFQTYYGGLRQSADKTQWIYGDVDLVSQFVNDGQGLKEWLEDQGATFHEDSQQTLIGALWYRENEFIGSTIDLDEDGEPEMGRWGAYFAAPLTTVFNSGNGSLMRRTTATDLIVEDGRVTGVKAVMYDGTEVTAHATKGVILATGGYATNTDMMLALQPMTMKMKANVPIGSTADGSGIKAILWAGGEMDPCHASMMFNRCSVLPTDTAGYKTNGKWYWFGEQPFLKVNLNGKRFCNESGPYEFMLHSMYMQPHHTYCDIFDANNKQYCEQFDEVGCCRLFPFDNGALSNMPYDYVWSSMTEGENSHLEMGYLQKADTLEELAEKLNIPVDAFVETVNRYNELCAKGVDEDYGKSAHRMTPVDTAPFYGIRTCAWHLTTLDGCRINTDMQVIREDGTPIEGLWATGDVTGGFFANNYPNLFTGLACGRTMTFGRRAAKIVVNGKA
ncbi:MAG: FAD-binding protein, partial [Clostridia bacterium]|nr:FAD-binding protein [Clostridia bacterium]